MQRFVNISVVYGFILIFKFDNDVYYVCAIYHQNCHEAFFCPRYFFLKIYVYKLVYYQVSTYVNRFFLSFWTYVHELVFNNSMFINSTYIPLCFFFF